MAIPMNVFAEYGAVGIIVFLFVMMIMNLIKSQKAQNADLDDIRVHITKIEGNVDNVEGIVLKMLDRWNKSDDTSARHREDIVKDLNEVTDDLSYLKGSLQPALNQVNVRTIIHCYHLYIYLLLQFHQLYHQITPKKQRNIAK